MPPIEFTKVGERFTVRAHSELRGVRWESPHPMSIDDLIQKLQELGFHPTDIGDALFFADKTFMRDHPVVKRHEHLRRTRVYSDQEDTGSQKGHDR